MKRLAVALAHDLTRALLGGVCGVAGHLLPSAPPGGHRCANCGWRP
jgi:hypothetical protein